MSHWNENAFVINSKYLCDRECMARKDDFGFSLVPEHVKWTLCLAPISQRAAVSLNINVTQRWVRVKAAVCFYGPESQSLVFYAFHPSSLGSPRLLTFIWISHIIASSRQCSLLCRMFLTFLAYRVRRAANTMEKKCGDWMPKWKAKPSHCLLSEEPSLEVALGA